MVFAASDVSPKVFQKWLQDCFAHLTGYVGTYFWHLILKTREPLKAGEGHRLLWAGDNGFCNKLHSVALGQYRV